MVPHGGFTGDETNTIVPDKDLEGDQISFLVHYGIFTGDYRDHIIDYKDLTGDYKTSVVNNGGLKMANNGDWLPSREQDLADLCQKWKAGLEKQANIANFGWKQAEVTELRKYCPNLMPF
jgi:hypothetical protein